MFLTTSLIAFACLIAAQAAAQPGFSTVGSVHFDVLYQKGVRESEAQDVVAWLEEDRSYLVSAVKVPAPNKVQVRLYDNEGKYLAATGQRKAWRGAWHERTTMHVQPVRALAAAGRLESSLSYELAVIVLEQTPAPRWLREAFAVHHAGMGMDAQPPVAVKMDRFADLDEMIQESPLPPRRDDAVFILGRTWRYFIDVYGEEKALGLFAAMSVTSEIDRVIKRQFGEELPAVEKGWSAWIASQITPFPGSVR